MTKGDIHWEIFEPSGESFILQDGLELKTLSELIPKKKLLFVWE